jgi:hypothetical protein
MAKILLDLGTQVLQTVFGGIVPIQAIALANSILTSFLESGQPFNETARLELLKVLDAALRDLQKELGV